MIDIKHHRKHLFQSHHTPQNIFWNLFKFFLKIEFYVSLYSSRESVFFFPFSNVINLQNRNMMGHLLGIQDRAHPWPLSNCIEIRDCVNNKLIFCILLITLWKGRNRFQISTIFDYPFTYTPTILLEVIGWNIIIIHHLSWKI